MSFIKWKNTDIIPSFYEMMESFFKDDGDFFSSSWKSTSPAVNVSKTDDSYDVEVAAPGLKKTDFKIEMENGLLHISAEQEHSNEEKEDNFTRKEFSYQSFKRTFHLPDDAEEHNVQAAYENGLLKIRIPRKAIVEKSSVKKIDIQ